MRRAHHQRFCHLFQGTPVERAVGVKSRIVKRTARTDQRKHAPCFDGFINGLLADTGGFLELLGCQQLFPLDPLLQRGRRIAAQFRHVDGIFLRIGHGRRLGCPGAGLGQYAAHIHRFPCSHARSRVARVVRAGVNHGIHTLVYLGPRACGPGSARTPGSSCTSVSITRRTRTGKNRPAGQSA
jgi:hypothetical protein